MSRITHHRVLALALAAGMTIACSEPGTAPIGVIGSLTDDPSPTVQKQGEELSSPGWQTQGRQLVAANNLSAIAAGRVYAALSVAQYGAVLASGDHIERGEGRSQTEWRRGAIAGASAQVLTFFFPAAAQVLEQRVQSEGEPRKGGSNVPPNFTRGLAIGRRVGDAIVERTKNDHFTAPWTGTVPTGPGNWISNGTPAGATFGGVTPWVLTSGRQFRPSAPPAFGSTAFQADLDEVRTFASGRTPEQQAMALQWNYGTGTFTPPGYWNLTAATYIAAKGMNERAATHAFALMHAAMMDALIGCWEAKYYYWTLRPSQAGSPITLSFGLPNHPSYPSGHSCVSAAAATVLSHLFPDKRTELDKQVSDAGLSRMYAGIHYRFDITAGRDLGVAVAQYAIGIDRRFGLLASRAE